MLTFNTTNLYNRAKLSPNKTVQPKQTVPCAPAAPVSFKGLFHAETKMPEIQVLPRVSDEFVKKVTQKISEFSPSWLKQLKNEGFKIVLAPSLTEGYTSQKVFDADMLQAEMTNPFGTHAATYFNKQLKKAFIVFADKKAASPEFIPGIVNHELAHGISDIKDMHHNPKILSAIKKDVSEIVSQKKLDRLSEAERKLVSSYFFNSKANSPTKEMIADAIAWQSKGGGCYGSGLIEGIHNPNLIRDLFPNLTATLAQEGPF